MKVLSQEVFDMWMKADEQFKKEMREHIASQTDWNRDLHGRVIALETSRKTDVIRLGIFSSFVSAVFGSIVAIWRH